MILYENIYEEMNKIDDEASLKASEKKIKKAPMNELFGMGKKSYYVGIAKTKGIDPERLVDEVKIAISSNKGKLDKLTYPEKISGAYTALRFEADDKTRQKIEDACDQISYEDVKDGKNDLSNVNKKPDELNRLVRKSILWQEAE